jgi:polar amino acid transport system substrate-binding protein
MFKMVGLVFIVIIIIGIVFLKFNIFNSKEENNQIVHQKFSIDCGIKIYCNIGPPYQISLSNDALTGYSVEIIEAIQKKINNTNKINVVPWARGYSEISLNDNVILFTMAQNEDRLNRFKWIGPLSTVKNCIFMKSTAKIDKVSLEYARNLKAIAVTNGDIMDQYLTNMKFMNLYRVNTLDSKFNMLMMDRVDAVASPEDSMYLWMDTSNKERDSIVNICEVLQTDFYIAFSKQFDEIEFRKWCNAYENLKTDGAIDILKRKYNIK